MRRCTIALLFTLTAPALHAQSPAPAPFPPVPTSVPRLNAPVDSADAGFAKWRRIPLPRHDNAPAAWTLRADDWDFLIATPRAMDAMDTSRIVDRTLESCRHPLNIADVDVAHVAAARPWAAFDSLVNDRPVLVISIMPVLHNSIECGSGNLGRPAMIRRGIRFVTAYMYDESRDPQSAVLFSRLRVVRPAILARAPAIVMSRNLVSSTVTDQLRLYIPYDAIAPDANGEMPDLELQIWSKAGGPPAHIPLPGGIMRAVWWDYLRWRGARLATSDRAAAAAPGAAPRALVRMPVPADAELRTALLREREHRDAEAAFITLERLGDPKLAVNDRRIALMSLANTFQADGDAPAAALVANELTGLDPCALSGSDTPQGAAIDAHGGMRAMAALLDRTRPAVRCTSFPVGATLLRGLLIPGYGQYRTWSRPVGVTTAALTVVGVVTAVSMLNSANSSYAKYSTTESGLAAYYRSSAKRDRAAAQNVAAATISLWLASAVEAEVRERIHAARLSSDRDFWLRPVVTSSATPHGTGTAVGLKFEFR